MRFGKISRSWLGAAGSLRRGQTIFIWSIFIPIVFLFIVIRIMPMISALSLSLTNAHLVRPVTKFVGLKNFYNLFSDEQFIQAFFNSIKFVIIAVPAEIFLGLLFAIMLSRKVKFEGIFQTLYFIPYILPMVPSAIIWRWFYSPGDFGLANHLLSQVGLPRVPWMSNSSILLLVIIGIHVWKNLGFYLIVFVVGLKNVPRDIRDAAKIDGSSEWQTIRYIELPMIKPILLFGTIIATLIAWSAFTEVYTMTQGTDVSSGAETHVLLLRMFQEVFLYNNIGKGCAISMVVFMMSVVLVLAQFKLFQKRK